MPVATLAAFTSTHSGHTFLGFQGQGLDPSPQAELVLVAETAAIVLLAATFVPRVADRDASSGVRVVAVAGVGAALLFIGCRVVLGRHVQTTVDAGAPSSVAIAGFAFTPQALTVAQGTTVTWTNGDALAHSVVATDQSFSSGALGSGAGFEITFDTPGEHAYVCGIHPEMSGTVTVTS